MQPYLLTRHYFIENNERNGSLAQITINGIEKGKWQGVASTTTLMEMTVRPWRLGREAAQLCAKYNISPPDASQVAASLSFGAKAFLTNDKRFAKLQELIDVIALDDFLK